MFVFDQLLCRSSSVADDDVYFIYALLRECIPIQCTVKIACVDFIQKDYIIVKQQTKSFYISGRGQHREATIHNLIDATARMYDRASDGVDVAYLAAMTPFTCVKQVSTQLFPPGLSD